MATVVFQTCFNMSTTTKLFVLFCTCSVVSCGDGYYWRDWNGTIPSDAYIAATDSKGPVYFAQAYVFNTGLLIGRIQKNDRFIFLNPSTSNGPLKLSSILKIFCSGSDSLLWLPTTPTLTPRLLNYIQPVIGGITNSNETVHVGKYDSDGHSFIGSVHTDKYLYYVNAAGEWASINAYEILVHEFDTISHC